MKIFRYHRVISLYFLIIPFILILNTPVLSSEHPFNNSSNWGGTGLMEIPNARILEDGVVRFGAAQALPFRWYYGGIGILPGFEFTGRITEVTNIYPEGFDPDYGGNVIGDVLN